MPLLFLFTVLSLHAQKETGTDSTLVRVYELKKDASIYSANEEYSKALFALNKAYKVSVVSNQGLKKQDSIKYSIKLNIAELQFYLRNYDQAILEVENAIAILTDKENPNLYAAAYSLKGFIATEQNDFINAEKYFTLADEIYVEKNNEKSRANVLLGLGILEFKKTEYSKAINFFNAALPVFKSDALDYQTILTLLNKSEALLGIKPESSKNLIASESAYTEAIQILENSSIERLKIRSYLVASKIDEAKGNLEGAMFHLQKFVKAKEENAKKYYSINTIDADEEANLDLKKTIELYKLEKEKDDQSMNFIKYTTGLSIALIVILSLLTLSLYKNNNLRAKANNLLLDKNTELQLSKEKAEQASLAKAQFLSTVTHELRTPLYAVTGLTHLLLDEDPKPQQTEHLNSLKFSGEYLLSLINNILDLNKLEANKVEIEHTTFDLKRRISDVLVALKKSAKDKNNKVTLDFDSALPEKLVGDPVKLSQVLINLIGNSLKFTQNGFVSVKVKKLEEKGNNILLHFEIEDDGVGISKKKQKTIFESFSQASLQVNRKFGGTGLGLSIVKNLLELMNSKIELESQIGQGSKFWFDISFEKVNDKQFELNNNTPKTIIDFALFEDKHVLVVEDNKINQMITRKILEKNKIICQVADNGLDAVKLIEENDFDVVLMDIHMPGISGIEATQKVRKFDEDLPIIALTAVTIDENLDEFYKAGFNDIIPKPFKTEEFFEKIYNILVKKETVA